VAAADTRLFEALKALRLQLAAEAHVPPYVICHDRTLAELAGKRPQSETELANINGLGARKIARYGVRLLDTISRFKEHSLLDNRLSATVNQTLALHLEGRGVEAIARERGLEVSTVYGHFAEAIAAGIIHARSVLTLDEAAIEEIRSVFNRLETAASRRLGPAHTALEGRYDYGVLKCLLAELA
jgi:ATP-dependent DNA helicase RecQ